MFGLFSRSKGKIIAVADVGSGSAAISIVALSKRGPSRILAAYRTQLASEDRGSDHSAVAIGTALQEAGQKALTAYSASPNAKNGPPSEVYAIVRAPWTASRTVSLVEHYPEERRITDEQMGAMAKRALAEAKDLDTKNLLEASVVKVELNGYPTMKPSGKRAHDVFVSVLLSTVDAQLRASVSAALQNVFPAHEARYRSHTRAMVGMLRADLALRNCVVVDLATEGTAVVVLRKGVVADQAISPAGIRFILSKLGALPEEVLSLMRMIEREQGDTDACKALQVKLAELEPELARGYGEQFGALAAERRLPNALLLLAHPDIEPWLSRFFSRIDFSQFTLTTQPFAVHRFSSRELSSWVEASPGVTADTSLAIAAALVHIESAGD